MYKPVFPLTGSQVTVYVEDEPIKVPEGMTATAALLYADRELFRTTYKKHDQRGPFCMMGVCQECLMEIDGAPNQQGCLTTVQEGMRIKRQNGVPSFAPKEQ